MWKNFNTFDRRLLVLSALVFVLCSYLLYDDSLITDWVGSRGESMGYLSRSQNNVRLKASTQTQFSDYKEGTLHRGDTLFTGPGSSAHVTLQDGTDVDIGENSVVQFTQVGSETVLNLSQGKAKSSSGKIKVVETDPTLSQQRKPSSELTLPRPVLSTPKAFELRKFRYLPDGNLDRNTNLTVEWTFPQASTTFELQVSADPKFEKIEFAETISQTSLTTPELKAGVHHIRIRDKGIDGKQGLWSKVSVVEFQFDQPLRAAELGSPQVDTQERILKMGPHSPIVLRWGAAQGAQKYVVEISRTADFKDSHKFTTPENELTLKDSELGHFYYRVVAVNSENEVSEATPAAPYKVELVPPVMHSVKKFEHFAINDADHGEPHVFTLTWEPTVQTARYRIAISSDPNFRNAVRIETAKTDTKFKVQRPGAFFWRIQSLDKSGHPISEHSQAGSINYVFHPPLVAPVLLEPLADMTLYFQRTQDNPFFLVWGPVEETLIYRIQIALDSSFQNLVLDTTTSRPKYLAASKLPQGLLHWRVRAEANERYSPWSEARAMTVLSGKARSIRRPANQPLPKSKRP